MLHWRISIGTLLVALLAGICWLDVHAHPPGLTVLAPLAIVICLLATEELLTILRAANLSPNSWSVRVATLAPVLAAFVPLVRDNFAGLSALERLGYVTVGQGLGLLTIVLSEVWSYEKNGRSTANMAAGVFCSLYLGGCLAFLVQLRQLAIGGDMARGGMLILLSLIAVVKCTDIGAYFTGRLWGRHKMAPSLSPGKTWEGLAGGMFTAIAASLVMLGPVASSLGATSSLRANNWLAGAVAYGLLVGAAGVVGDLAESLLKRDAGKKDSSSWLPGFGGVLDVIDSLLLAAPVAYFLWVLEMVTT